MGAQWNEVLVRLPFDDAREAPRLWRKDDRGAYQEIATEFRPVVSDEELRLICLRLSVQHLDKATDILGSPATDAVARARKLFEYVRPDE